MTLTSVQLSPQHPFKVLLKVMKVVFMIHADDKKALDIGVPHNGPFKEPS